MFPVIIHAQPACIGVQLTIRGEVKILLPNEYYHYNNSDSVYYYEEDETGTLKGATVDQFNEYLRLVDQQDFFKQRIREREAWAFNEANAPKPIFQKPTSSQNCVADHFWPDSTLLAQQKATIRNLLKDYIRKNYALDNWSSVISTWETLKSKLSSLIREAVIYEYEGQKLTGVISYDEEYNVIMYDQLYYNFLGQLTVLHRKSIGETGGINYTFHYDKNNRLAHINKVNAGFFRDGYEQSTLFSYKYFKYDQLGLISVICQQDNFTRPLKVISWRLK